MNDTIKNIAAHPVIKERIKAGTLDLFGMMLNMGNTNIALTAAALYSANPAWNSS